MFEFGFWNYLPSGTLDKSIVWKWKEMNCTLPMSFRFLEGKSDPAEMIELLDECQKAGLKVIINDERCEYLRLKRMSKEEFRKGVEAAVRDFGSHPAVYGFYGGDEPFSDQEENFAYTMSLLKGLLPNQHHFGNLLPYWSGLLGEPSENHREDAYYNEKIRRIIRDGDLSILGFDQYTQCYDEGHDQAEGVRSFLYSMHRFHRLAKENGIPLFVSLLSIGHWGYREPTEYDIRWQINLAAALGAKGIIWFYFHQTAKDYGYLNPPFLGERAYITPMFGRIQRQQYIFQERYQEIFDKIEIDEIYSKGNDFGLPLYQPTPGIVDRFDVRDKEKISLVSMGHRIDDQKRLVIIITNADQKCGNAFSIYFTDGEVFHFDLGPGEMRVFEKESNQ